VKLERNPTNQEIGKLLGISAKRVSYLDLISRDIQSLDIPIGEDGQDTMSELIEDENAQFEDKVCDSILVEETLKVAKQRLSDEQFEALRLNLGLNCRQHTLAEIAE